MKKESIMQKDFEKFLKSLPNKNVVDTESTFGDWWYTFAFGNNIYLALYSGGDDDYVRIQRIAGINETADFNLLNLLNDKMGCEATPPLIVSQNYDVSNSSDMKYIYIHNN